MKLEVKPPVLIGIGVIVVAGLLFFGLQFIGNSGNLDQGQVKYTPGKPPWEETDASRKGPGGPPGGGGPGAGAMPPGTAAGIPVGPPVVGSGVK